MADQIIAVLTSGGRNDGWTQPHHLLIETLAGLRDALQNDGAAPLLLAQDHPDLAGALSHSAIAGVIALSGLSDEAVETIRRTDKPTVWVDCNVWEPQRCLRRDEVRAGQMVAHVALAGGCTNVLYLCASESNPAKAHYSHSQRMEGLRSVTERRGLPLEILEVADWWDPQPIQVLFGTYTPQTAVICSNFYIADWLTAHVLAAGPGIADMPLFSCDDARKPLLHMLRLTRAGFDRYGMGVRAARMALRVVREPASPCPSELMEPDIIPHNVTPPPIGDSLPEGDPLAFVEKHAAVA